MPLIVGALEAVANLHEQMEMLEIEKKEVDRVQLSALQESARILRKLLDLPG